MSGGAQGGLIVVGRNLQMQTTGYRRLEGAEQLQILGANLVLRTALLLRNKDRI